MKRKVLWLLVSGLMVVALVLASCGPAVTEEEEEEEVVTEEEEEVVGEEEEEEEEEEGPEMVRDSVGNLVEKPQYGGVFTLGSPTGPRYTDEVLLLKHYAATMQYTNEELIIGDWAKGPTGTGETTWTHNMYPGPNIQAGWLASSWELAEPDTLVFHIRQGVYFHDKPPVNGREMTADDVVFSLIRMWTTPTAYPSFGYPWKTHMEELDGGPWIEATDKWTVVIKAQPGKAGSIYEMATTHVKIVPPEVFDVYGEKALEDWRNAVGTGPYLLDDYVQDSSFTVVRNPNYWASDPLHPDNRLPYLDGVKYLVIPDLSTRVAALRTAKVDLLGAYSGALDWEEASTLMKTNPELKYNRYLSATMSAVGFGMTKTDLPFADVKVRQAMAMAVDQQELIDTYFGGQAELILFPSSPYMPETYTPFDQLPESVTELYSYNPEKAKELLAEAGYPDGFKTEILTTTTSTDLLSVIAYYFAEIGIDMEMNVKDPVVFSSMSRARTYNAMVMGSHTHTTSLKLWEIQADNTLNTSGINDPRIEEAFILQARDYFDDAARKQRVKELLPYFVEQVFKIQLPTPYLYTFWQPWVKGYHGEHTVGYSAFEMYQYFIWLDQDLREEMTGQR